MRKYFIQYIAVIILFLPIQLFSEVTSVKLTLEGNKLEGKFNWRKYTGMKIELNNSSTKLVGQSFFNNLPLKGYLYLPDNNKVKIVFIKTERAGYPQILLKPAVSSMMGWYTFDDLVINEKTMTFTLDSDPVVPPEQHDLDIILETKKLLSDASKWQRIDDRICVEDKKEGKYSIFCALKIASENVMGEYNHRSSSMQLMRHMIQLEYQDVKFAHRFRDFNNLPETSYEDIRRILDYAEALIRKKLKNN